MCFDSIKDLQILAIYLSSHQTFTQEASSHQASTQQTSSHKASTQQASSHQTITQVALQTGIGPTGNTIPDTIDCIYSHQPRNSR